MRIGDCPECVRFVLNLHFYEECTEVCTSVADDIPRTSSETSKDLSVQYLSVYHHGGHEGPRRRVGI